MNIIEFKNVSKSFFSQRLYKHVDLEINSFDKIALVGHNGSGKSTFLKLITGEELPNKGDIIINEEAKIVCFDQFGKVDPTKKVSELLNEPFERVIEIQGKLEEISAKFTDETADYDALLEEYSQLNDIFESLGGYDYMHIQSEFIETFGLGDKLERVFKELSGGEKQYIRLAVSLFKEADLVILDEPLSFFDRKKTEWLAKFIADSKKAFLVISHNVDFIRGFANKIFDVDNNTITPYECGYSQYLKEKKAKIKEERKHNLKIDLDIAELEEAVRKKYILLERCNNKHAHAIILKRMLKELVKLNKQKIEHSDEYKYEYATPPEEMYISKRYAGNEILSLKNISKSFPEKFLYKDVNLDVERDTKLCIVGENGCGKSTLLKIMLGEEEPTSGNVLINKDAKISFIQQETVFKDENMTIKNYLKEETGLSDDFIEAAIDSLYNYEMEFRDKKIFMLSGGEKKRLEIFSKILSETDLLIIDEPSTYMDDYSRTTIANMLMEFEGAVIIVTHDKALLREIDFPIYDIRDNRFRLKKEGKNQSEVK